MNYDEALAKVKEEIGADCIVTNVETKPYGWMFRYAKDLTAYWENWEDWEDPSIIGGGPTFVDKFGEFFGVPIFPIFASKCFYRNWELSHPEYESDSKLDNPTVSNNEDDECNTTYSVNKILLYALEDKASEIRLESLSNLFGFRFILCVNNEWHDQWKAPYYALVAQRFKQMAEIPTRGKNDLSVQNGSFHLTAGGAKYLISVTATIVEGCEHLSLRIEAQ